MTKHLYFHLEDSKNRCFHAKCRIETEEGIHTMGVKFRCFGKKCVWKDWADASDSQNKSGPKQSDTTERWMTAEQAETEGLKIKQGEY